MRDPAINVADIREAQRAEYLHAIEMARAIHDPCEDWEGFVEKLWSALISALGLDAQVLDASDHHQQLDGLQGPPD